MTRFHAFSEDLNTSRSSELTPNSGSHSGSKIPVPKLDLSDVIETDRDKKGLENNEIINRSKSGSKRKENTTESNADDIVTEKDPEIGKVITRKSSKLNDHKRKHNREIIDGVTHEKVGEKARSKTQTLIVHKHGSKIPVRARSGAILNSSIDSEMSYTALQSQTLDLDESTKTKLKARKLNSLNDKFKGESETGVVAEVKEQRKSHTAVEYEKRVRSSGYGAPIHPNLRPARSATLTSSAFRQKRQRSVTSAKSLVVKAQKPTPDSFVKPNDTMKDKTAAAVVRETHKSNVFEKLNRRLVKEQDTTNQFSLPKIGEISHRTELTKISEIVREESTTSELPDEPELQARLSAIKRKVEVRRRRGDSRSSFGSDLDTSFQDRYKSYYS